VRDPQAPQPQAVAVGGASQATAPAPAPAPAHAVAANPADARKASTTSAAAAAKGATPRPRTPGQAVAQAPAARDPVKEQGVNGLVPPSVTCKDKVFLAKEFCVYTECQKPAFQNFPSCVQLREDAKLRDSGKYGQ
jgi:serine/threonine-protein kinase